MILHVKEPKMVSVIHSDPTRQNPLRIPCQKQPPDVTLPQTFSHGSQSTYLLQLFLSESQRLQIKATYNAPSWACDLRCSMGSACLMLGSCHFEVLNNFSQRGPTFLFCTWLCKLCSRSYLPATKDQPSGLQKATPFPDGSSWVLLG